MAGRLIAVVGPSGAGKDSLLGALLQARADDLHLAQRMITRPTNAGGEDFVGLNVAEFQAKKAAGAFVVDWEAHGLFYGIPWAEFTPLDQGKDVIFNGSRQHLPKAKALFSALETVLITAPIPVLTQRLAARGRETASEITARLARAPYDLPAITPLYQVQNDQSLDHGLAQLLKLLDGR